MSVLEKLHDVSVGNDANLAEFRRSIPEENGPLVLSQLTDGDQKKAILDLLKERSKIYEEQAERSEFSAETYLWLANAGFTAALVTLESRTGSVLVSSGAKISLCCFMISIAIIGWIKAYRIIRNYRLRENFKKSYVRFLISEISLQQLLNFDRNVSREPRALIYPGWACYFLFFLGVFFLVINVITR